MRCLALADELRRRGAEVVFVSREQPGHLCGLLAARGFDVLRLPAPRREPGLFGSAGSEAQAGEACAASQGREPPHARWLGEAWEVDAAQTQSLLAASAQWDWLVVDHYGLDGRWERVVRSRARRIMVLDDLADKEHDCDLLLDQNYRAGGRCRYAGKVADACVLLLGPRYALLRPEFAGARSRLQERGGELVRVLVSFGAYDPGGQTLKAVRALSRAGIPDLQLQVVTGTSNPDRAEIEELCRRLPHAAVHAHVENLAELMLTSDLAIGAAGTTTWERCCLGLPSLMIGIADNQLQTADELGRDGYCLYLGRAGDVTEDQIADALRALRRLPHWLRFLGRNCLQLVDGLGVQRVAAHLVQHDVSLRPAVREDADALFEWRNAPENRRFALDPGPLSLVNHRKWVDTVLADPERVLLIAQEADRPVGVLRYDVAGTSARVSIYLAPGNHGRGLGPRVLAAGGRWMREHRPKVASLTAEIKTDNIASTAAFRAAGFTSDFEVFRQVLRDAS